MPLYRAQDRLIIARLEIELLKIVHKGRLGKSSRATLAGEVELLLISGTVLIGHVSGHPRNSTDISRSLGIPRATVQRKLGILIKRKVVQRTEGRRYCMVDRTPGENYSYIDAALSLIRDAAKKIPAT